MIFLGTGAAECVPDPFCSCEMCQAVRASGDRREYRRRSSFLYDEETMIDCNPDSMFACAEWDISLEKLQRVLLTHSHDDHFRLENLTFIENSYTRRQPITFYGSRALCEGMEAHLEQAQKSRYPEIRAYYERMLQYGRLVALDPYQTYQMGALTVEPLTGNHRAYFESERSQLYLLTKNGQTLLYATDTGVMPPETMDYLRGRRLDLCVIEGTYGRKLLPAGAPHMDLQTLSETIRTLYAQQTVDEHSRIIITHISHHSRMLRDEYRKELEHLYPGGLEIAYDGMQIP